MSSFLIDSLIGSLPKAQLQRFFLLLDGLICLCLVGFDEIVLNLLVGSAEHPSQVFLETKHFCRIALDELSGVERFLLVYVAVGVVEGVVAFAEVSGMVS